MFVRVTPYSADYAKEVASAMKDRLAKQNISVFGVRSEEPKKHWGRAFFDGITFVLEMLAIVSVIISAVLVYNTLSNLITQQTNQIGVLKAIGGRSGTIVQIYLSEAFVYALLALVVAIPLGALVTFYLTQVFLGLFNIDYNDFEVSTSAVTFQVISAIAVTLLAGLIPTLQGAMITVRQAIASYGLGSDFGSTGWTASSKELARACSRRITLPHSETCSSQGALAHDANRAHHRRGWVFVGDESQFVPYAHARSTLCAASLRHHRSVFKFATRRPSDNTCQYGRWG